MIKGECQSCGKTYRLPEGGGKIPVQGLWRDRGAAGGAGSGWRIRGRQVLSLLWGRESGGGRVFAASAAAASPFPRPPAAGACGGRRSPAPGVTDERQASREARRLLGRLTLVKIFYGLAAVVYGAIFLKTLQVALAQPTLFHHASWGLQGHPGLFGGGWCCSCSSSSVASAPQPFFWSLVMASPGHPGPGHASRGRRNLRLHHRV